MVGDPGIFSSRLLRRDRRRVEEDRMRVRSERWGRQTREWRRGSVESLVLTVLVLVTRSLKLEAPDKQIPATPGTWVRVFDG